jgi:hypothetical protein
LEDEGTAGCSAEIPDELETAVAKVARAWMYVSAARATAGGLRVNGDGVPYVRR